MTWNSSTIVAEVFYCMIGAMFVLNGIKALKDTELKTRILTAAFWFLVAFTFIAGPYIPKWITGACVVAMACLTASRRVKQSASNVPTAEETRANADRFGFKVFIPALSLALVAVLAATFGKGLGANNAIGISALVALLVALCLFKAKPAAALADGTRLLDSVGPIGLLPQVLSALGALFTAAGVGDVIAAGVGMVVPVGSRLAAVAVYCIAMALFTMIMGNGFAAFSVITVGIGIPFVIAQGGDPVVVGTLGLTSGYCGTLVTPMAANFNIMPAALLETRSKYAIIISQIPVAVTMLIFHIILMYVLAF